MAAFTCPSCKILLHTRLRARLSFLASLRSTVHSRSLKLAPKPPKVAYYWDTVPPTDSQLAAATYFIETHQPRKLWTANEWRKQNEAEDASQDALKNELIPEVAFLGRSNVGKSSLLNALLQAPELNRVGPRPGKTTTMHAWGLSASDPKTGGAGPGGEMKVRLTVLDMPGYGFASRDEWGKEIVTYLRRRKQLRRAFVLIDALHGIKSSDEQMVQLLRKEGISHQIIVSKAERLLASNKGARNTSLQAFFELVRSDIVQPSSGRGVKGVGEILAVGKLGDDKRSGIYRERDMLGIDRVRWAVLVAAGLEEWATKRASASLNKKKQTSNTGSEPSMRDKEIMVPRTPNEHRLDDHKQTSSASTQTHASSLSPSFPRPTSEGNAGAGRTPFFASSESTSASSQTTEYSRLIPPAKKVIQHEGSMPPPARLASPEVGGLAELEAQLSSNPKSSMKDRKAARSSRARTPVRMSEDLSKRLPPKREGTMNEIRSQRADEDYREPGRSFPGTEKMTYAGSSPPAPPPSPPAMQYASRPSPGMQNGKGVGGMADLLATSRSSSSGGYNKTGSGTGRGRVSKSGADRRVPVQRWKREKEEKMLIKKRRPKARGRFKAEAKAKALARPDNVGW